jgi:cytochrome c peroxidase
MRRLFFIDILVAAIGSTTITGVVLFRNTGLSDAKLSVARSLSLASLPKFRPDPSNAVGYNADAIELGALLFNDTGMSADANVSCATCHLENRQF